MHYVEHLIKHRTSQLWRISDEQQQLASAEIEGAGATIKHWRICRTDDAAAIDASNAYIKEISNREKAAISKLLRFYPITVCVVHDNEQETDKKRIRKSLDESFAALSHGEDKFISRSCDTYDLTEKPSVAIPDNIERGNGSIEVFGFAKNTKDAMNLLQAEDYFNTE
jgi:hypothetical protein